MAITAHFVDDEWKLNKKIINFVIVPCKARGENLADIIISSLHEWNIEKICTITMDNCTANDVVARILSEHFSSRGMILLNGRALHMRCWAHILNLIVQEGLDEIKESIQKFRNAVKYVKGSAKRKLEFLNYADQERVPRAKMLVLDVCTRWNSTYSMFNSALHYKKAYDSMRSRNANFKDPPNVEDWVKAEIVHGFLESFYIATNIFSGSKYCTSNVFFREVYRILMLLRETLNDPNNLLGTMALEMLVKFEKYWVEKEPNILLSIAVVLDSRFKVKYLRFCYNKIYHSGMVTNFISRVENELHNLFDEYTKSYEDLCRIKDASKRSKKRNEGLSQSSTTCSSKKRDEFMEEFYKFNEDHEDVSQHKTELDVYLEEKLHQSSTLDEDGFNILEWWKINSSKFLILSLMACDILAIPVTSVASESAFSTGGRVLSRFVLHFYLQPLKH